MSFAAVVFATRCGFPATAALAEKVDCKDDQDGQDDYQDGHDVQDDHQDDRDHDVQDDYHEDQDVLDIVICYQYHTNPFALISGSFLIICPHLFPEPCSILGTFFHYKQM